MRKIQGLAVSLPQVIPLALLAASIQCQLPRPFTSTKQSFPLVGHQIFSCVGRRFGGDEVVRGYLECQYEGLPILGLGFLSYRHSLAYRKVLKRSIHVLVNYGNLIPQCSPREIERCKRFPKQDWVAG